MSRRRIQLEGSLPWHPDLVSEAMEELFPKIVFLPFEEAREHVIKMGFKKVKEWEKYCSCGEKPDNIPSNPSTIYKKKGWIHWGDFLGTGRHLGQWLSFEEAKKIVRELGIKTCVEWKKYCKLGKVPNGIPRSIDDIYKNEWISWGDFLGTGSVATFNQKFVSFEEAREFVIKLGLKGQKEWREYSKSNKKPNNIPSTPDKTYKNKGWTNWGDFLGTGNATPGTQVWIPFEEARKFAIKLGLKGQKEWREYCNSGKKPNNIPYCPFRTYKNKGWINWKDFLGTAK